MSFSVFSGDFVTLRNAWAATPGGRGGPAALAGFDFQLALALLEIVRRYTDRGTDTVFVEALSDLAAANTGAIAITQAKRTLASGKLREALDELWSIDVLARRIVPDLAPHLSYQVVAARRELRDWEATKDRWKPSGTDDTALRAFKERVTCDCIPDPRLEAARLLALNFNDSNPLDRADKFVSWLLGAATTNSFENAVQRITIELTGLRRATQDRDRALRLWGSADRPPTHVTFERDQRKAVRIGERLLISDLREGRLADRKVYELIHRACENCLQQVDGASGKIPAFWIEGRSGTGKSAALLSILAKLHEEDPSRVIIWLGDRSEALGEAVLRSAPYIREGRHVIIAADDPYTAERQMFEGAVRRARDEWDRIRSGELEAEREAPQPPLIVCCSPTEQRQDAEKECCGDLDVTPFELPPETDEDLAELAEWYQTRTGQSASFIEGNTLLVQRFFEWKNGKITDFAQRFRRRLERFDHGRDEKRVFDTIAGILALGRLYADYPAEAIDDARNIDPVLDRAFIQLADEEAHFSFERRARHNIHTGIRLTHPHLANAIYRTWFGLPIDRGYRAQHLREAFRTAVARASLPPGQRFAPLWAIARIVTGRLPSSMLSRSDIQERVEFVEEELRTVFRELYAKLAPEASQKPLTDLPVWTDLDVGFDLGLAPSPLLRLKEAILAASAPLPGLRLASHKLIEHHQHQFSAPNSLVVVASLLDRLADWRSHDGRMWYDWFPLAADFIRKAGPTQLLQPLERVVRAFPAWTAVAHLMRELSSTLDRHHALRGLLLSWLNTTPSWFPAWAGVLGDIHEKTGRCDKFDDLALRFLSERPNHGSWSFFWQYLWRGGIVDKDLLECRALCWLGIRPNESTYPIADDATVGGYDRVWQDLWSHFAEANRDRTELLDAALKWLGEIEPDDGGWTYVYQDIWTAREAASRLSCLRDQARRWLEAAKPSHHSWSFIWSDVWGTAATSDEQSILTRMAEHWLEIAPGNPGWNFVWQKLWQSAEIDAPLHSTLISSAKRWLISVDLSHSGWSFICSQLWDTAKSDGPFFDELERRAGSWLVQDEFEHTGWTHLWRKLWQTAGDNLELRQLLLTRANGWFDRADPDDKGWTFVWEDLWNFLADDATRRADLISRAESWLAVVGGNHPGWAYVWNQVWKVKPDDRDILERYAQNWLDHSNASHLGWSYVWLDLWQSNFDVEYRGILAAKAELFLTQANSDHSGWTYVFEALWKDAINRVHLAALGANWLTRVNPDHVRWEHIWQLFWDDNTNDQSTLKAIAANWLTEVQANNARWGFVWLHLWNVAVDNAFDRNLLASEGKNWLGSTDINNGGWSFVWAQLWSNTALYPRSKGALRALADNWITEVNDNHGGWSYVWEQLWSDSQKDDGRQVRLLNFAEAWLQRVNAGHGGFAFIWKFLWQRADDTSGRRIILIDLATEWLKTVDLRHEGWTYVWEPLWTAFASEPGYQNLRSLAEEWLADRSNRSARWPHIWLLIWQSDSTDATARSRLTERASDWLGQTHSPIRGWSLVWRELWKLAENGFEKATQLGAVARQWLVGADHDDAGWPYVWQDLWGRYGHDASQGAELVALANAWLAKAGPNHGAWSYVWAAVWAAQSTDQRQDLTLDGLNWLENVDSNDGRWTFVWEELWKAEQDGSRRTQLSGLGLRWLSIANSNFATWQYVWLALWDNRDVDGRYDELEGMARIWLGNIDPEHGGWNYVWDRLWKSDQDTPSRSSLFDQAMAWLRTVDPKHGGWSFIWQELWKACSDETARLALTAQADEWLDRIDSSHLSWPYVWQILWATGQADRSRRSDLKRKADQWLGLVGSTHPGRKYVWGALWEASRDDESLRLELRNQTSASLGALKNPENWAWSDAWQSLWDIAAHDPDQRRELAVIARGWLADPVPGQRGWTSIWRALWKESLAQRVAFNELMRLAEAWLAVSGPNHPRWTGVWLEMWSITKDAQELQRVLRHHAEIYLERVSHTDEKSREVREALTDAPSGELRIEDVTEGIVAKSIEAKLEISSSGDIGSNETQH